jgi:hypothetical protein
MLLEDRLAQIVPTLTPAQIEFALRFASGPAKHFVRDEKLLDVGDRNTAVWLVRISNRHLRPSADGTRIYTSAEIRCTICSPRFGR